MRLGERATVSRVFDSGSLADFAGLAGLDRPPTDVPEPLIAGLFSYLLGVRLPGSGTNYLKQDIMFHGIAHAGDELTASVEIVRFRPEKHLCDLATRCVDSAGRLIADGRALVSVRDVDAAMEGPGLAGFGFVREQGDGIPLLLLHGWSVHSGFFAPQQALARDGFRVILPDLPGLGETIASPAAIPSIADQADALHQFLEARDLSGVVLGGWSMGAFVAFDYIRRHGTARLKALVIIDMSPKIINDATWRLGLKSGLTAASGERAAHQMETDWPQYAPHVAAPLFAETLPASSALLGLAEVAIARNDPATLAHLWRDMIAADHRATVAAITLPTLILRGADSQLYGADVADWLNAAMPDARIATIADSGHVPHLEQPEAFNQALREFVTGIGR